MKDTNTFPESLRLGVNIDHIATLRQARHTAYPDLLTAAKIAEASGGDYITLHLREDRRHIQGDDVTVLRERLSCAMNLEMAITDEMLAIAEKVKPQDCCLVPEKREELTTEGGLDVLGQLLQVQQACERLAAAGITVSLFIDADFAQIDAAKAAGAPVIELHTGQYALATGEAQVSELERIQKATKYANELGLKVNAGHGLHYENVQPIAAIPHISELNIGHAIICKSVFVGLAEAVGEMKSLMLSAR